MEIGPKGIDDILIVEDSPTQARQLEILLREQGFRATVAVNGRAGISKARSNKPNLIISDINMPEMNGYEMCRSIKQDPILQDIPVILLTSLIEPANVIEAINVNAECYISKPYDDKYLLAKINQLLIGPVTRKVDRPGEDLEFDFAGKQVSVTASRTQILTLLISIYEDMVLKNRELMSTKGVLDAAYEDLEKKVGLRTMDLRKVNKTLAGSDQ